MYQKVNSFKDSPDAYYITTARNFSNASQTLPRATSTRLDAFCRDEFHRDFRAQQQSRFK
jgi:hypothetical protein